MKDERLAQKKVFLAIIFIAVIIVGIMFSVSINYQIKDKQAKATSVAIPTMTAETLDFLYRKGVGYINLSRWQDAKVTFESIFEVDPDYKDVQARLIEVEANIKTSNPLSTVMPTLIATVQNIPLSDNGVITLNIKPQEPVAPINIPIELSSSPEIAGDLAWNKPTFASSYWKEKYPSGATSGKVWVSASSTRSWFYVDLGQSENIYQIVTTLFVDSNFSTAPQTAYIVSNDLKNWQIVLEETNYQNASHRGQLRILTLAEPVNARYVGLYAKDWDGGWGNQKDFVVLPLESAIKE